MSVRTLAKPPGGGAVALFAQGIYTGNGAATQAVVGVGFKPKFVLIYPRLVLIPGPDIPSNIWWGQKSDQDGVNACAYQDGVGVDYYNADDIISLDADGFTVGDGTVTATNYFNLVATDYTWVAWG